MAGPSSQHGHGQPRSIWSRKRDMFYVFFLSCVVFLALALDLVPWYPVKLPSWGTALYDYYNANYHDPLYVKDPPFFQLFILIEAVYSVPLSIWAIRGLIKDDKTVPVHLLVFATYLVTTTAVCLVELLYTKDWPKEDINKNLPGYVGFLVIAALLWLDMFTRVKIALVGKAKLN